MKYLFLVTVFAIVGCTEEISNEVKNSSSSDNNNRTLTEVEKFRNKSIRLVHKMDEELSYVMHKYGNVNQPCEIEAPTLGFEASDYSKTDGARSIDCILDAEELDLFENGANIELQVDEFLCEYVEYRPYSFVNDLYGASFNTYFSVQCDASCTAALPGICGKTFDSWNTAAINENNKGVGELTSKADACHFSYEDRNCDLGWSQETVISYTTPVSTNPDVTAVCSSSAVSEVSTIDTSGAASAAALDGTFFILQTATGSVGFWYDVDNSGTTQPSGVDGATTVVEIDTIVTGDTLADVATDTQTEINNISGLTAPAPAGTVITVTVDDEINVPDADAGDTGFTVAVSTQGSAGFDRTAITAEKQSCGGTIGACLEGPGKESNVSTVALSNFEGVRAGREFVQIFNNQDLESFTQEFEYQAPKDSGFTDQTNMSIANYSRICANITEGDIKTNSYDNFSRVALRGADLELLNSPRFESGQRIDPFETYFTNTLNENLQTTRIQYDQVDNEQGYKYALRNGDEDVDDKLGDFLDTTTGDGAGNDDYFGFYGYVTDAVDTTRIERVQLAHHPLHAAYGVQPYYSFKCQDKARDTKAQIRLFIREWDRRFELDNTYLSQSSDFSSSGEKFMDLNLDAQDGTEPWNDYSDLDDHLFQRKVFFNNNEQCSMSDFSVPDGSGGFDTRFDPRNGRHRHSRQSFPQIK